MTEFVLTLLAVLPLICACKTTRTTSSENTKEKSQEDNYIPKDLEDCFVQLKKLLKPEDIEKMQSNAEAAMRKYHFGLGMWMRNNWKLWSGAHLAKWFHDQGGPQSYFGPPLRSSH